MSNSERAGAVNAGTASRPLSVDEHIENLESEGRRFGAVVARTPLDAAVPGCPEWDVEALIRHLGDVHRWAATIVRDRVQERLRRDFAGPRDRDALLAWYAEGHAQLLDALRGAIPSDQFWTWAPAPSAQAFWARRQAHETAIHRLDAEQATDSASPTPATAAADGVDEWLMIASRLVKVPDGRGRRLHLTSDDVVGEWLVELRDDGIGVQRGATGGECSVSAPASELFALVLNRRDPVGLHVEGDVDLLRAWRDSARF